MLTIDLRKETVNSTLFPQKVLNYLNDKVEFVHWPPGKEHYKLLACISSQLSNAKILDLGTYLGHSAVALSINLSNIVFSFDVGDYVFNKCRKKPNIRYFVYDLFNEDNREYNKDLILKSDLIFIDINPHDGNSEKDFYEWLKNNNYGGIVIWDDVYLNDRMKEFWKTIPNENKLDLTNIGHSTGTGLTFFDVRKYKFII
jgi:predicted O-methyltransferase YrrM